MPKQSLGRKGEDRAARALESKGMTILARNFRSTAGEIDIIALDNDVLVFVEVKTWRSYGIEDLEFAIDIKKQRRIIETAKYFCNAHRKYNYMIQRFDVIFIGPESACKSTIEGQEGGLIHLASAFMERE
ncbi:YraN family protein [Breznakiellaceae bacterium SP9]